MSGINSRIAKLEAIAKQLKAKKQDQNLVDLAKRYAAMGDDELLATYHQMMNEPRSPKLQTELERLKTLDTSELIKEYFHRIHEPAYL